MASIYLDVPFVSKLAYFGPDNPMNDRTGCWYASACMVGYYFEAEPRPSMPENWDPVKGHSAMKNEEYPISDGERAPCPRRSANEQGMGRRTDAGPVAPVRAIVVRLEQDLGEIRKTYGHRSVVIGYDDGRNEVILHDPELLPNFRLTLANFNTRFGWSNPYGMLRHDGSELVRATGSWPEPAARGANRRRSQRHSRADANFAPSTSDASF